MTGPLIALTDVSFAFGERPVLRNVNIAVAAGEIYGLVGADGAGKSTLLRLAIGQLGADSGNIAILGQDPSYPALKDDLAYMPQGFGLYQDLSVAENLAFFADLHGLPRERAVERVGELLARTGLTGFEARRAENLSGGMMQKLALACALVSRPRVMFLDEPTTGVDPLSRRAFWALLDGVRAEGVAILYATANMDEAERCDRVGFLEAGRLTHQGTPLDLVRGDSVLLGVYGPDVRRQRTTLRALGGVRLVFPEGPTLKVWLEPGQTVEAFHAALATACPGCDARILEPSLHDIILRDLALAGGERAVGAAV